MKQNFVAATFAIAFATWVTGCAGETSGPSSETGSVDLNIIIDGVDVKSVAFDVVCDSGTNLSGELNVNDEKDPPIAATIMDLPPGPCSVSLTAFDDQGVALCTGSADFVVLVDQTVDANVVLQCGEPGDDSLGNVSITGTFEFIEGNNCPRLHFLNAVPNKIPDGGSSAVTVLVSDADGDPLTTALTATSGSFGDPAARSTTYTCGAGGTQTIRVSVTDGDAACDKTKSFDVECGGASTVCDYEQDFEALDMESPTALSDDGWQFFANVFDSGGNFLFNYGPFGALNAAVDPFGIFISAVVSGEGGRDQGAQQLSVYSDYNCCQPSNGHFPVGSGTDRVEISVFQEINPIPAALIGQTFTFTFDARRGNIEGATTALAYIQTLDPDVGFARTNFITIDTTNLPFDWNRYEISLDLSDPALEGQILQFGFQNTASSFDGSGVFYDNITFGPDGCGGDGGGGIDLRPLPEIYTTGNAINYGPYRAGGPGSGEFPSDADLLEDLSLMDTAGYNLIRLFGADPVHERILQLAEANFPEMQFQQGLFLGGLAPGPEADNCDSAINDSQVATAIRLADTYPSVVTVSVGNETSFFAAFMPLNCLEGYITETRDKVTQPVTADDDYTFYANFFGRSPDNVLNLIDFVSIHTYPFLNYRQWDWKQEAAPAAGLQRAEAMMNASLAKAQQNYQAVYDYRYLDASGTSVTIGESLPIVIGETGWKWRQTNPNQEIEEYAADPVNAKWYYDLMLTWERSPGGPPTIFIFSAFDEEWKQEFSDDGWGFWDELRQPNYVLCGTPVQDAPPCNNPVYQGAGFYVAPTP